MRTCAGCGRRAPRADLHRFARVNGALVPDPAAVLPGRGAWLHESQQCFAAAVSRRGFQRAFRGPVHIPQNIVDSTHTWPRSASTS
ncbi:MAG: YlxR family protein [Solirubrobacterales bacterium]|nr:YlxR family protein [Solirubrobacterales bacterium]